MRGSDFKESFLEVLWIASNTVKSFWFWLPIAFMVFTIFQLWTMFYIHPLTLAVVPAILIVYGLLEEDKRARAKYGLQKTKHLRAGHSLGSKPEPLKEFEWEIEKTVEQYEELLDDDEDQ